MPLLLDTNVYLFALKSEEGATFFEHRFLPLVFRTYLSSVVVEELYAGALRRADERDKLQRRLDVRRCEMQSGSRQAVRQEWRSWCGRFFGLA